MKNIVLVGAGISNLTIARMLADMTIPSTIVEKELEIGGTSKSHFEHGIEVHNYGPHIFHTDQKRVWDFANRFTEFNSYHHRVAARVNGQTYFLPFNLSLINKFFFVDLNPAEARSYLEGWIESQKVEHPKNLEEQAINLVGKDLYEAFIKGYTQKQWNTDPKNLDPSIIKRIPIRYNYNTDYFNDPYQGIPLNGYQKWFENLAASPLINVELHKEVTLDEMKKHIDDTIYVFSGQIDKLLNYSLGVLPWRSVRFETETLDVDDYQGIACVNYTSADVPFTRINEYKHYHPETMNKIGNVTVLGREYPQDYNPSINEAFYPILNDKNLDLYGKYVEMLKQECPNVVLCGRLANYKYFDMDDAIGNAMDTAGLLVEKIA